MIFNSLIIEGYVYNIKPLNNAVTFSLGYFEHSKDGERKSFFNCVAFGDTATNFLDKVSEKDKVILQGRLQENVYNDREGNTIRKVNIIMLYFNVMPSSPKKENSYQKPAKNAIREPKEPREPKIKEEYPKQEQYYAPNDEYSDYPVDESTPF